jgi:hypothetical protein
VNANLDAFATTTAERLTPDRAARWLSYFDVFSSTIPSEVTEAEYADLTLGAWVDFRKNDSDAQADAVSAAWGIKRFKKLPRLQPRTKQPVAVVVKPAVKPWTPCGFWKIPKEPCLTHKHAMHETPMLKAQSLFEVHARFVRRHILVELQPWSGGKRYDVNDIESVVWWNVAQRMPEWLPLLETHYTFDDDTEVANWWTSAKTPEQARAQMFLRAVVHTTVIDVVRGNHAEKRDVRLEVPIPASAGDRGIPNPCDPPPAKPTPTANTRNLMKEADGVRWDAAHPA